MDTRGKLWGVVGLVLAAVAAWWWARRAAAAGGDAVALDVTGANIDVTNSNEIQQIQVYEWAGVETRAGYYERNNYGRGVVKTGELVFRPGDWYSLLPKEPPEVVSADRTQTNEQKLMVPWVSLWKMRVVTVGEADTHGIISPPVFARA